MDDRILLHQVHPIKLAADISASVISNALLWQHRPVAGLVTRYALPVVGSGIVLSSADVERLQGSAAGRYVLANMSPAAMAVRLGGDLVMAVVPASATDRARAADCGRRMVGGVGSLHAGNPATLISTPAAAGTFPG